MEYIFQNWGIAWTHHFVVGLILFETVCDLCWLFRPEKSLKLARLSRLRHRNHEQIFVVISSIFPLRFICKNIFYSWCRFIQCCIKKKVYFVDMRVVGNTCWWQDVVCQSWITMMSYIENKSLCLKSWTDCFITIRVIGSFCYFCKSENEYLCSQEYHSKNCGVHGELRDMIDRGAWS